MKLIAAPGSRNMQQAIASPYVRSIVEGMFSVKGKPIFNLIARFLREFDQNNNPSFQKKLLALRANQAGRPDAEGNTTVSPVFAKMLNAIETLYNQRQIEVQYQRGAIVELLTGKLVEGRCQADECYNNYLFIDGRYSSEQVDVIVYAPPRQECEGYTCKMNPNALTSADCTNLTELSKKLQSYEYDTHIGAICFDHSLLIERRIREKLEILGITLFPKAYGLNNLLELERSPFIS